MATTKPKQSNRILRKADLVKLRDTKTACEADRKRALENEQKHLQRARDLALQKISKIIADTEEMATNRIQSMEADIAQLVSQTVRAIIGSYEPEEATYQAALQALSQIREHKQGRIFSAHDVVDPIRKAVAALGEEHAEDLQVLIDPALEPGQAFFINDQGSAEIGLSALTDLALRSWDIPPPKRTS